MNRPRGRSPLRPSLVYVHLRVLYFSWYTPSAPWNPSGFSEGGLDITSCVKPGIILSITFVWHQNVCWRPIRERRVNVNHSNLKSDWVGVESIFYKFHWIPGPRRQILYPLECHWSPELPVATVVHPEFLVDPPCWGFVTVFIVVSYIVWQIFDGNNDKDTPVTKVVPRFPSAKLIRFWPVKVEKWTVLRVEVYGIVQGMHVCPWQPSFLPLVYWYCRIVT